MIADDIKEKENSCLEFYKKIGFKIYSHQKESCSLLGNHQNIILATGTGSGKTEAVLFPALIGKKRIILIYPTKALLQDQVSRVKELWKKVQTPSEDRHVSIDTGGESDETLFRADIILTTIDKFLYRVFGYGSARWGYIYPWRIAQGSQKKTLLVFDEAHVYDEISLTHFLFLIDKLTYEKRIQTAVLSATLPSALSKHLRDHERNYFPRPKDENDFFRYVEEKPGEVKRGTIHYFGHLDKADEIIRKATGAYNQGKQVIVIANRVYPAQTEESNESTAISGFSVKELWDGFKNELGDQASNDLILYHGHQFPSQRQEFLRKLQQLDESRKARKSPYILITTSAFEVGVDVSCDLMFTEVCNPNAFIQRTGRCARRENDQGEVYTFGRISQAQPEKRSARGELLSLLKSYKNKILDASAKAQINDLNIFETTLLVRRRNTITYTIDAALYNYIYGFEATGADIWQKGILVTRDWVPTLEIQPDGWDSEERLRLPANYSVPRELVKGWWFEVRDEDSRLIRIHGKNVLEQLKSRGVSTKQKAVNAYQATLILLLKPEAWDNVFGLIKRQYAKEKKEFESLGVSKCTVQPLPDGPSLFWFEPEEKI